MSIKQMKWHAGVLAVTVFAALTVLFALATVTSNADTSYDPETRTYTMTGGTYDEQIILADDLITTIKISGENKLTYGSTTGNPCIYGNGDLRIIGDGTLDVSGGSIMCKNFTVVDNANLIIRSTSGLSASGTVTVDNAGIESQSKNLVFGTYNNTSVKHILNNAQLKITLPATTYYNSNYGLTLYGEGVFNDCNVTFENATVETGRNVLTIDGGTYNFTQSATNPNPPLRVTFKAVIKNAVIKTNATLQLQNLEMTDSTFESTIPPAQEGASYGHSPAIWGDNLVFSGCKLNIDGSPIIGLAGIQQLIIANNTEMNIKGLYFGIVSKELQITHSSGTIQATDPEATAAVSASTIGFYSGGSVIPGNLTLKNLTVREPVGYTIAELRTKVKPNVISNGTEVAIKTIMDGETPAKVVVLETTHITHNWDAGKVTKEPTETAEGVKTYTCTVCGATKTEAIPKLIPKVPAAGADGTVFGKGASVAAAEAAILALPNDNDPAGTAFGLLQLKETKVTKKSINLKWKAVPGAAKYIIFANKCGTGNKYKKLGEVTGTSLNVTQAAGAAIQKGTYYKFMMIAADANGKVVSTSKTVHAATKGGKVGNHKKVTVKKSVTKKAKKLKKGKTLKLKAKAVPQAKKLKVRKHRGIMYETSNPAVAQVNGKGTVKGVGKGTCYIYAYAQNGTCAKVKVTVK